MRRLVAALVATVVVFGALAALAQSSANHRCGGGRDGDRIWANTATSCQFARLTYQGVVGQHGHVIFTGQWLPVLVWYPPTRRDYVVHCHVGATVVSCHSGPRRIWIYY